MTGLEQALTYIEREIRFMSKDHSGGFTNARYADKVIEEVCGIPHFCSRVLSSQKPLSAIFKYTSGDRGNILMKFFNASLHDTRIDIVMVLAESERLKKYQDKKSRNAYAYMVKLYQKAVSKMIKLLTGSKSKETYKSMYKELCSFADMRPKKKVKVRMPEIPFIDDEDDDEDEDSDYNDDSLNPEYLEAISKKVELVEKTLGRELTYDEIDKIVKDYQYDEDDDDFDDDEDSDEEDDDDVIDKIAARVVEMLAPQIGGLPTMGEPSIPAKPIESFEDFVERMERETNSFKMHDDDVTEQEDSDDEPEDAVEVSIEIPNTSNDDLDEKNELNSRGLKFSAMIVDENLIDENASPEQLIRYHNYLPDNPEKVTPKVTDNPQNESDNKETESTNKDSEGDSDTVDNPTDEKSSVGVTIDYITNFDITPMAKEFTSVVNSMENSCTFDGTEVEFSDVVVILEPAKKEDYLINLDIRTRYLGTYDCFNADPILRKIRELRSKISDTLNIPVEKIDYDFNYSVGDSTYNADLKSLQAIADEADSNKLYTKDSISKIYALASMLICYIYKKYDYEVKISIINDPESKLVEFYLANKHKKSDQSKENNILTELPAIMEFINNNFDINIEVHFNPETGTNFDKSILEKEYAIIEDRVYSDDFINSNNAIIDKNIMYQFDYFSPDNTGEIPKPIKQYVANDVIIANNAITLNTEFTVQVAKFSVDQDDFEEMGEYISSKAECIMMPYLYLHAMVSDISIRFKISMVEVELEKEK